MTPNPIEDLKKAFRSGNVMIRLIFINVVVFVAVNIIQFVMYGMKMPPQTFDDFLRWLAVPAQFTTALMRIWTFVTYMFLHEGFMHILFNMLWLYWFGSIFLHLLSPKQLVGVYILGGITGALFFILVFNLLPLFRQIVPGAYALGASASVLAIVIATAVHAPNYTINLLLFGPVKIKYIAMISVVLDIVNLMSDNAGGHLAHLGGAIFGYLYIWQLRKGYDWTSGINNAIDWFVSLVTGKPRPKKMRVAYRGTQQQQPPRDDIEYNRQKKVSQEEIDRILDKISQTGYSSLNEEEKDLLFRMSKQK